MRWAYKGNFITKPTRVAQAVVRAATSRCPRTRYRLGTASFSVTVLHALLPARWWDALLRKIMTININS